MNPVMLGAAVAVIFALGVGFGWLLRDRAKHRWCTSCGRHNGPMCFRCWLAQPNRSTTETWSEWR